MKKSQLIGGILLFGIFGSILFAGTAAAVESYLPDPEDVEGYDLIWEKIIEVENPLDSSADNVSAGSQIWVKNDTTNNVIAVVGVSVVKFSEDVFGKKLPTLIRMALSLYPEYEDVETYWDLLVKAVTVAAEVNDISHLISTTDGAIEFDMGGGAYFILAKDAEFLIFTLAFEISNDWIAYVVEYYNDVPDFFEAGLVVMASFLAAFQTIVNLIGGEIPTPVASSSLLPGAPLPLAEYTSAADVQYVTTQIGAIYGSSNLLWIILGVVGGVVVIGGLLLFVGRKRK
ncbi:MAG: hypothetical protein JW776_09345 [Candidatus Lokiarchaeota archaeon]|nr:hypothetical protein [Candidatus Lokiarchaeota archaeon]